MHVSLKLVGVPVWLLLIIQIVIIIWINVQLMMRLHVDQQELVLIMDLR